MEKFAVYLLSTSNTALNEKLNNGETVEGFLEINHSLGEATFTCGDRIAFKFSTFSRNEDSQEMTLAGDMDYFRFSRKTPDTIKQVV